MNVRVEISDKDVRELVRQFVSDKTGQPVRLEDVKIEVKSKQNYRSEWESASFRAVYESLV